MTAMRCGGSFLPSSIHANWQRAICASSAADSSTAFGSSVIVLTFRGFGLANVGGNGIGNDVGPQKGASSIRSADVPIIVRDPNYRIVSCGLFATSVVYPRVERIVCRIRSAI